MLPHQSTNEIGKFGCIWPNRLAIHIKWNMDFGLMQPCIYVSLLSNFPSTFLLTTFSIKLTSNLFLFFFGLGLLPYLSA